MPTVNGTHSIPTRSVNGAHPPASTPSTRVLRSQTKVLEEAAKSARAATQWQRTMKRLYTIHNRPHRDPWARKRKVNPNPRPRPPPPSHFTCRICISHLPSADFIGWVPPKRGRWGMLLDAPLPCIPHLARNPSLRRVDPVCKACVGRFMAARLDTHGVRQVGVGCLEPGCTTPWSWDLVMKYLPADSIEAYNLAAFDIWRADARFFTCLDPACGAAGLLEASAPGYPHVKCNDCSARACVSCVTPWHAGQTCAEVAAVAVDAQMSDPERETLALMQSKDGKRCPNCQLVIEKDGGCSSMWCPGCQKYFNWDAAASAVLGEKKPLATLGGEGYGQQVGTVVCEMDRLKGTVRRLWG